MLSHLRANLADQGQNHRIAVITLQAFTEVKPIYRGQIHQKSSEVNSFGFCFT